MNPLSLLVILAGFLGMLSAQAQEVSEEGVGVMKEKYYKSFRDLPPSRNCVPADVAGLWEQREILENDQSQMRADHRRYLRFGGYNQFAEAELPMRDAVSHDALPFTVEGALKQYIVSVRGLLYFYENNTLRTTKLCFIAEQKVGEREKGDLLLMDLLEEKKPLVVDMYRLIPENVAEEADYGR